MSQNDFNIANQGFPSFRSDLNSALQALASNSAGTTAPTTTYAYQWWYDETTDILKIRNGDNDAWIDFATFDQLTDTWSLASLVVSGDLTVDTDTLYVDSTNNRVGIGTSGPAHTLDVAGECQFAVDGGGSSSVYRFQNTGTTSGDHAIVRIAIDGNTASSYIQFGDADDSNVGQIEYDHSTNDLKINTAASEALRVLNNGQTLIGQTSSTTGRKLCVSGSGQFTGEIHAVAADGDQAAAGTDGAVGVRIQEQGMITLNRDASYSLLISRSTDDGQLVRFYQAGNLEGNISVSGTTVSYNGGHLARWSQTADNTRIDGLLKGTVLTNLDQMAVWGDEDNEQLNCMAVSSVEGDPNVAGVFVNWDDDDDEYTSDMNVAMTGDMIIRIGAGVTVERGDLLMSAGDGTAKPQGDDIVRSKTIAKVTSTHVAFTYDDGSYCVPCVLMAC